MFSEKDLLNAKEIYLSRHDEILIPVEGRNVGYCFTKDSLSWNVTKRWYSWKVYCRELTPGEALDIIGKWKEEVNEKADLLNKAIEFATKKHRGQMRKGTLIPYILHPLEALEILYAMRADTSLMIAGVLHDTVEDTDTTLDEIKEIFGEEVSGLVAFCTADKGNNWEESKQHTIHKIKNADRNLKMLAIADKLSNLRSIATDYKNIGDTLWERFNAPREKIAWYYSEILDSIEALQDIPECESLYWEFLGLFKDVFVEYSIDEESGILYQISPSGQNYYLTKDECVWKPLSTDFAGYVSQCIENLVATEDKIPRFIKHGISLDVLPTLSRKEAELIEDIWRLQLKSK